MFVATGDTHHTGFFIIIICVFLCMYPSHGRNEEMISHSRKHFPGNFRK